MQPARWRFAMPNVDMNANVGGGTFLGADGRAGAGGMFDGDIIPLQRIPPQYPRDAARSGITGWVQLEVLVNADGTVRSARVLESQSQGIVRGGGRAGSAALEIQAQGGERHTGAAEGRATH